MENLEIEYKLIDVNDVEDVVDNARFRVDGRTYNHAYDQIRESIVKTEGRYLNFEVHETEVPGKYRIFKGGSTRLEITKALSNDCDIDGISNPFRMVQCSVSPKIEEHKSIILGVGENIIRGEMCYGERCIALKNLVRAYGMEEEGEFEIQEFLDYLKENGLSGLVKLKREYWYMKRCADEFIYQDVLTEIIIRGRANREWITKAQMLRGKFIERYLRESGDDTDDRAVEEFNQLCRTVDRVDLTISELRETLEKYVLEKNVEGPETLEEMGTGGQSSDDIRVEYANRFDETFKLVEDSLEESLNGDRGHNALLFIGEFVRTGEIRKSKKRTYSLKKMEVRHNDLTGFVDLINLLPRDAKKLALKEIFG